MLLNIGIRFSCLLWLFALSFFGTGNEHAPLMLEDKVLKYLWRVVHVCTIIWYSQVVLGGFEEDLGSDVVFCFDEWFIAFGNHCLVLPTYMTFYPFLFPFAVSVLYCLSGGACSCLMLVTFLTTHLFHFYFADTAFSRSSGLSSDTACLVGPTHSVPAWAALEYGISAAFALAPWQFAGEGVDEGASRLQ